MDTLVSIEVDGDVSIHLCFCDRDWEVQLYTYELHFGHHTFPASNCRHHEPKTPSRLWPSVNYKTRKGLTRQQRFFFPVNHGKENPNLLRLRASDDF